ncbi:hypothetical protein FB446DRAFT_709549, partial [Lentinula raphanica]
ILITKVPWFTLIQNWGRISAILASPQEALHEAWVGSIIIVIVQLYYLRRLAKFASTTRHVHTWYLWLIFIVLVALSVLQVRKFPVHRFIVWSSVARGLTASCILNTQEQSVHSIIRRTRRHTKEDRITVNNATRRR